MTERKEKKSKTETVDAADEARQKAVDEAREDAERRLKENEEWHSKAEKKGEQAKPHKQDREAAVTHSDHHLEEATVVAQVGGADPEHPATGGQEDLGMGPIRTLRDSRKGAPLQPPGRTRVTHTVPSSTKPDGTPLVFPAVTGIGAQAAKTSGASFVQQGGPGAGSGVVLSDIVSTNPAALPTFSDRVITDGDMGGVASVVPSGAPNLPRAEAPHRGVVPGVPDRPTLPERVESDRTLGPDAPPVINQTVDTLNRERPHGGGGEALGMGETHFKNFGAPADEPKTSNEVKAERKARSESKPAAVKAARKSGQKAHELETKIQAVKNSPQAAANPVKGETPNDMKIETKDVKSNPETEQKDKPVETGTDKPSDEK